MERWVEEIEGWDSRSFSGGYAGLHDLADDSFSGAVSAGSTWLLFVNGRVVSVGEYRQTAAGDEFEPGEPGPDGDIQAFEEASGTVYEAPHPSVPLLVAMQFADGEARGRYYTEKTPISEVQNTLSEGGFTGYVELSENVLSGDYYTVYQAGRSMDVAFVGNARRLKTDEEASELTRDEVGIYEVIAVDLDVTEIPEATGGSTAGAAAGAGGAAATGAGSGLETTDEGDDAGASHSTEPDSSRGEASEVDTDTGATETADVSTETDTGRVESADASEESDSPGGLGVAGGPDDGGSDIGSDDPLAPESGVEEPDRTATDDRTADTEREQGTERGADSTEYDPTSPTPDTDQDQPADDEHSRADDAQSESGPVGQSAADTVTETTGAGTATGTSSGDGTTAASPAEQLASRSVPSLDPERTDTGGGARTAGGSRAQSAERGERDGRTDVSSSDGSAVDDGAREETSASSAGELTELRKEVETLRRSLRTVEAERDEATKELEEIESELERVKTERNELIDERDELEAEADRLRARVAELEEQVDLPGEGPSLSEAEALSATNLFVRYESKGMTTVEDVHDGSGSPDDLEMNLRISAHTQFASEDAFVAGEPFIDWLHDEQRYRFANWLVSQLVFEIRDTDSADSMRDLYDALPEIDRIEFNSEIAVDSADAPDGVTFDVVCRDRMGDPLIVANLDAAREPVEEAEMGELVTDAIAVCHSEESFAAAFYVTAAFFESPALETARDATSGSLLSRDSRLSYVKESRKRGFHLGLVESRDGAFHLSVPDL